MLVIGNGESRKYYNIDLYNGVKIGCNAICRQHYVDHLICVDRRMVDEATQLYEHNFSTIYTRKDWAKQRKHISKLQVVPDLPYEGILRPDDPFHWGSGPYAILLASYIVADKNINIIGFDLYGIDKKVNNLYKDTQHYDKSHKSAVDPRYWIHQIAKIFECFPNKRYTLYAPADWTLPKSWKYPNVSLDNINNL